MNDYNFSIFNVLMLKNMPRRANVNKDLKMIHRNRTVEFYN